MMTKILTIILFALLLNACGSENKSETEKNTNTITPTKLEELAKKTTAPAVEKAQEKKSPTTTQASNEKPTKATTEKLAKDIFQLITIDGKTLHIDEAQDGIIFQEYKGKVVFLLFFGHRCPPCLGEIPALKALAEEKHKDLEIVAMEVQRLPSEQLKLFQKDKGINYTLLSGEEKNNEPFISYIGQRAQWGGSIPFFVAINPHGEVKVVHVGGMSFKEFKTIYEKLAQEK